MTFTPSKDPKTMTAQERRLMLADVLDSGEYAKTTGHLRTTDPTAEGGQGYCCLGVACDLYRRFAGDDHADWFGDSFRIEFSPGEFDTDSDDYDEREGDLPERVRLWFGFADESGSAPGLPHGANSLVILNDGDTTGMHSDATFDAEPFPVIAQVIRERF